jgi:hypothetical protein
MTLRQLIAQHPTMFYEQQWYLREPFMDLDVPLDGMELRPPDGFTPMLWAREFGERHAVLLAACYVQHPQHEVWTRYLWTSDRDSLGQAVYLGDNGKGLEIHRHLNLTSRWGHPTWS